MPFKGVQLLIVYLNPCNWWHFEISFVVSQSLKNISLSDPFGFMSSGICRHQEEWGKELVLVYSKPQLILFNREGKIGHGENGKTACCLYCPPPEINPVIILQLVMTANWIETIGLILLPSLANGKRDGWLLNIQGTINQHKPGCTQINVHKDPSPCQ